MYQASDRAFGIEIECYVPNSHAGDFPVGRYHNGIQLNMAPDGWNGQKDGSLRDCPSGHFAVEVVSPILAGEEGFYQAVYMAEYLDEIEAKVNSTTGLHIHVDARDLTPDQVEAVVAHFKRYEKAFYALSGEHGRRRWDNTTYCKHSALWGHFTADTRVVAHSQDRYCSVNTTNYYQGTKKTIEIRVWQATTYDVEIIAAVYMALAMVTEALNAKEIDDTRIADPVVAMRTFQKVHFTSPTNLIIPEADDLTEITSQMNKRAREAKKAGL